MCAATVRVRADADSSPVAAVTVKALTWRIIQDSRGVLTHPDNTPGVTGWGGGGFRGVKGKPNLRRRKEKLGV